MRVDTDLGDDQARDAGGPVQERVAHRAADLIERGIGLRDIKQAALGLVEREALPSTFSASCATLNRAKGVPSAPAAIGERAGSAVTSGMAATSRRSRSSV
ncbi:hypothetical protein [Falsiroseomonas sp. E2-1-a4]|uniref:hypothetical protein n=1 Tax=Falsiroseomonas sp. E2-1-a4 TaxID=3239299 RepID=UPI003F34BC96